MRSTRTIACVVSRLKSTRLPRKAVADVAGAPLTLRLVERLRTAVAVDGIVLCTSTHPDDRELLDLAASWGVDSFAGSEEDVLSRLISVGEEHGAHQVLRVTGDNVLTCPELIDRMVERASAMGAQYARVNDLPLGATAELLTLEMCRDLHRNMPDPSQSEYLMLYAFNPDRYRCCVLPAPESVQRPNYSVTVDTPEDIERIRWLWSSCPSHDGGPRLEDVVAQLDAREDYVGLSSDAVIRLPGGETGTYGSLLTMLRERAERATQRPG